MKKLSFLFLISIIFFGNSCKPDSPLANNYPREANIEYRATIVSGSVAKAVNISYVNATGGTSDVADAPFPFKTSFKTTVNRADDLSLSVFINNSANPGAYAYKLEIVVDGKVVATETNTTSAPAIKAIAYIFP